MLAAVSRELLCPLAKAYLMCLLGQVCWFSLHVDLFWVVTCAVTITTNEFCVCAELGQDGLAPGVCEWAKIRRRPDQRGSFCSFRAAFLRTEANSVISFLDKASVNPVLD